MSFHPNNSKAQRGGKAVAVPGEIKGYWEMHQKLGVLPWEDLFAPIIALCDEGFEVSRHTGNALNGARNVIMNEPSLKEIFVNPETGDVYKQGDTLKRPVLARTLEKIATPTGADDFYTGLIAKDILDDLQEFGSIITAEDLQKYQ